MLKNKILSLLCFVVAGFVSLCSSPATVFGETHINYGYGYVNYDANWNKEGSPYILDEDVYIPRYHSLTIGPGVVIMSASSTNPWLNSIEFDGNIKILGSIDEPVRFVGLDTIHFSGSDSHIENTNFVGMGLDMISATTTMLNVSITHVPVAITAKQSRIDIDQSDLSSNGKAILSNVWTRGPLLTSIVDPNAIGGIGNALDQIFALNDVMDSKQNVIIVHNSTLESNSTSSQIVNNTQNPVDAKNNWWGSSDSSKIRTTGLVYTDPWLSENPIKTQAPVAIDPPVPICCSNVIFLPGIEASRLYRDEPSQWGKSTNTLWEPNINDDVRKLYLDNSGSSTDPTIYTKDVIDSVSIFKLKDVYRSFIDAMNALVAGKKINAWLPFAYDWRKNVQDVALSLVGKVIELANSSKTGKVTLVAHSNGGLVAKMLGLELEKRGMSGKLDKVILVAVPQLGTPEAVASVLHGIDQSIPVIGGVIMSTSVARTFALSMPGAYGLLPSNDYFKKASTSTIDFTNNMIGTFDMSKYGKQIDNYSLFKSFLTAAFDTRKRADYLSEGSDVRIPGVLSDSILSVAEWIHSSLDNWHFATSTKLFTIAGWGRSTTSGIKYNKDKIYTKEDIDGDGTVLSTSATGNDPLAIYFNQALFEHEGNKSIDHSNILEAVPIKSLVSNVITSDNVSMLPNGDLGSKYLTTTKPNSADFPWLSWIEVSVHSPVDIDVYDSHGGHVGVVPLSDPTSDLKGLDNTIPNASYRQIGEEKYVTLLGGDTYKIELKGTGIGSFTYEVRKFSGDLETELGSSSYADLPVTPTLFASTTVSYANISPDLNIDFDSNGSTDIKVKQGATFNPYIYLDSMKSFILSLKLPKPVEVTYLNRIEKIRSSMKKGNALKIEKSVKKAIDLVEMNHIDFKKVTDGGQKPVLDILTKLLSLLDIDYSK